MTILTVSNPSDTHGRVVHCCLLESGHQSKRLFGRSFPQECELTFHLDASGTETVALSDDDGTLQLGSDDTLWMRRPSAPSASRAWNAEESEIIQRENLAFFRSVYLILSKSLFSVNDYSNRNTADAKLMQLSLAKRVGMVVPPTLASNSPGAIREFMLGAPDKELIFKTFTPVTWMEDGGAKMLYATRVGVAAIDDPALRNAAALWQHPIEKSFEVRATIMGESCFAAKILSQETSQGRTDWRRARGAYAMEPYQLPSALQEKCFQLMRMLKIVFGCFDFIVTPSQDYVFLEVNEMGQFFWVEERVPELTLLDAFTDFLTQRDRRFSYRKKQKPWSIEKLYNTTLYRQIQAADELKLQGEQDEQAA